MKSRFPVFCLPLLFCASAMAESGSWSPSGGGLWSSPSNWSPAAVPGTEPGDAISISSNITSNASITVDFPVVLGDLTIGDTNGSHSFALAAGTGNLTFDGSGTGTRIEQTAASAANAITANLVLADKLTINNASAKELAIGVSGAVGNHQISETGGAQSIVIENTGSGAVAFYSQNNTFTGGVEINAGTLQARGASAAFGNGTIYLGATSGSADATLKGTQSGGSPAIANRIVVRAGSSGTAAIRAADAGSLSTFSGSVELQRDVVFNHVNTGSNSSLALSFSGNFSGSGRVKIINSSGASPWPSSYVSLGGNNSAFAGVVEVTQNSVLRLSGAGALNSNTPVEIAGGGSLRLNTANSTIAGLSDSGGSGGNATRIATAGNGTLILAGSPDFSFGGTISDGGSSAILGLTKTGSGTQTLTGDLTYSGPTTVTGGVLIIGADYAAAGQIIVRGGSLQIAGDLVASSSTTISGQLLVGGNMSAEGPLSITGGSLKVEGNLSGSGGVSVGANGTLDCSGIVSASATIAGQHSPGPGTANSSFASNLTYLYGSSLIWKLSANSEDESASDKIAVGGNLVFSGRTSLVPSFVGEVDWADDFWSAPHAWTVFEVAGTVSGANNLLLSAAPWADAQGTELADARPGWTFVLAQEGGKISLLYLRIENIPTPTILPPYAEISMAQTTVPFASDYGTAPVSFLLWENGAPGSPEPLHRGWDGTSTGTSAGVSASIVAVSNWGYPNVDMWLPPGGGAGKPAIMICPGGAYMALSIDWRRWVDRFLQEGFAVFMLRYRTVPGWTDVETYALLDAKRAVRFIRTYSNLLGIDQNRIGVVGASAGSNLVLNLITHPDGGNPSDADILERPGCGVAFAGMLCPWPTPANRPVSYYPISAQTAPSFVATAKDDEGAPTSWAVGIDAAFQAAGAPSSLWQIETGGHLAFHSEFPNGEGALWIEHFLDWISAVAPAPTPYATWAAANSLAGELADSAADPDGDGITNTAEFAFGTNPSKAEGNPLAVAQDDLGPKITFLKRDGVSYTVRSSAALDDGFPGIVESFRSDPQPAGLPEGYEEYGAHFPSGDRSFLRVDAEIAP